MHSCTVRHNTSIHDAVERSAIDMIWYNKYTDIVLHSRQQIQDVKRSTKTKYHLKGDKFSLSNRLPGRRGQEWLHTAVVLLGPETLDHGRVPHHQRRTRPV